ncbi:MAG: HD domain-containing protein, partial [Phascolarctobacterium sp.]|nr:HD domain-containing protein [Phascolarctobacterium sp.]
HNGRNLLHREKPTVGLSSIIRQANTYSATDTFFAGALLHDIGKLREISSQIGFPYTNEGRLLGHIAMSIIIVQEAAAKLKLPAARLEQLQHILLSHHGDNEKGSPVECATKEAFIVHYADEIDAIMNQFETYDDKNPWEYNKMMQRYLLHDK